MNEEYSGAPERLVIPGDTIESSGEITAGSGTIKIENGNQLNSKIITGVIDKLKQIA